MFKSFLYHTRRDNQTKQSIFKVKESSKAVRLVQPSEIDAVSAHLDTSRDRLILKTLQLTGARIAEVLELRIADIPYPDSALPISSLQDIKSKGGLRTQYLPTSLLEKSTDIFWRKEPNRYHTRFNFVSLRKSIMGNPLSYRAINEVFRTAMKKAGVSFHFHALRHTLISALVESGMDISVVRIIAGHRQITTHSIHSYFQPKSFESLNKY
jgi:integrase